jgi:hypothetical protein
MLNIMSVISCELVYSIFMNNVISMTNLPHLAFASHAILHGDDFREGKNLLASIGPSLVVLRPGVLREKEGGTYAYDCDPK